MPTLRRVLCLAVLVTAAIISGCAKTSPPPTAVVTPQNDPKAAKPAAKLRFAGIVFQEDQFFRLVLFGMRDAAKKAGVELLEANSNNNPGKEIELINTYVSQKVDAILISPLSPKGSMAALKLARDKGITVIAHNTPIEGDTHQAYIECSAEDLGAQTGKAAVQYITSKLGGRANIAVVAFDSQVPEQSKARTKGFVDQVSTLPGVKVVAHQDAWLPEMAVKKVTDMLTANPDINLVWSANEGGTIGSVMAVKNAGKAGKVAVFGTDSSQQLLDFLQAPDEVLQAVTSQKPVDVGRMAVEFALKVKNGEKVEKTTSMQGVLLSRADKAGVKAFAEQFKLWTQGG
ncbi:MAG: substrate-binding domain-containing protein [Armatimonadetes bacterium]|nr:substrate-binding domain-containing protein [Armatimonadota bacterium]